MNTLNAENLRSRLLTAKLPSPPQTLLKLMQLCQDDEAGLNELAEVIALDPSLCAKVLSVAHSAAYHSADSGQLTLLQACNRLGTELIKVLVIAEMVTQTFNAFLPAGRVDLRYFWKHSLQVALIAKELAQRLGYAASAQAYLAGLLHDIGRLALLVVAPEASTPLFADDDDEALSQKEQDHVGMSHTDAAAWLLDRWHLSDSLVDCVLHHHDDAHRMTQARPLTRLLHLAHRLAKLPLDQPDATANLDMAAELSAADLAAVMQNAQHMLVQAARDLGLDISDTEAPVHAAAGQVSTPTTQAVQAELTQKLFDRSVLNSMAMNLIGCSSNESALRHLRQYASALLQLENSVVMLLRSNQQQLVPVSMSERHEAASKLSYDMAKDAAFARCVETRQVVFSGRSDRCAIALLNVLDAGELVLIPIISARQCMGVLAAAVPDDLHTHVNDQTAMLQAFGVYAGLALTKRRQTTMAPQTLDVISKNEQRQGMLKLIKDLSVKTEPMTTVDLCQAVSEVVQCLKDGRLIPGNTKIHCQLADHPTMVRGSASMIKRITLTLISNAFERMTREGDIIISAGSVSHRNGTMCTALTLSDETVSTTQSIEAQLQEYTCITAGNDTRAAGLSEITPMVEKMAGHLSFSTNKSGTRFDILLPCAKRLQLVA